MLKKRVDANQSELVTAFKRMGATVLNLSGVGKGCPDLLLGINNYNVLVEIKDGKKCNSCTKLTPHQKKFFDSWRGEAYVITSLEEAVKLVNYMRDRSHVKFML